MYAESAATSCTIQWQVELGRLVFSFSCAGRTASTVLLATAVRVAGLVRCFAATAASCRLRPAYSMCYELTRLSAFTSRPSPALVGQSGDTANQLSPSPRINTALFSPYDCLIGFI